MIPTLQSIRNSKSTSSLSLKPLSNRTGSFSSNTISGDMVNQSNRFSVVMANPFPMIPSVHYAALPIITSMTTMAAMGSTSAKSADRLSLPAKLLTHLLDSPVLTVAILSCLRKTVSFSAYISASIPNVLTISIISKKWSKKIWTRIMEKINISSITSTVNSP